jgi:hypothetical protein
MFSFEIDLSIGGPIEKLDLLLPTVYFELVFYYWVLKFFPDLELYKMLRTEFLPSLMLILLS